MMNNVATNLIKFHSLQRTFFLDIIFEFQRCKKKGKTWTRKQRTCGASLWPCGRWPLEKYRSRTSAPKKLEWRCVGITRFCLVRKFLAFDIYIHFYLTFLFFDVNSVLWERFNIWRKFRRNHSPSPTDLNLRLVLFGKSLSLEVLFRLPRICLKRNILRFSFCSLWKREREN